MNAGKKFEWDEIELNLKVTGTFSRTSSDFSVGILGTNVCRTTPSRIEIPDFIRLEAEATDGGVGPLTTGRSYRLVIPDLSYDNTVDFPTYASVLTTKLRILNPKMYVLPNGSWEMFFSGAEWYVEGVLEETFGSFSVVGGILSPAGIPLLGVPCELQAGAIINPQMVIGWGAFGGGSDSVHSVQVNTEVEGGWRAKIGGAWEAFPVLFDILEPVDPVGCEEDVAFNSVSGSDTNTIKVHAHAISYGQSTNLGIWECFECPGGFVADTPTRYQVTEYIRRAENGSSSAVALPNLPKSVKRFNGSEYAATIGMGGTPQVRSVATSDCCKATFNSSCDPPVGSCSDIKVVFSEKFPEQQARWGGITDEEHEMEYIFTLPTYAPYSVSGDSFTARDFGLSVVSPGACPEGGGAPTCCFEGERYLRTKQISSFFPSTQSRTGAGGNSTMMSYYDHSDMVARYINYCAHPHYSYYYAAPVDQDVDNWKVYGVKRNFPDYWGKIREQYNSHTTLLSGSDDRKSRNSIVSAPWLESGLKQFAKTNLWGVETSYWGINSFIPQLWNPDANNQLTQSETANWSFVNCTPSFGVTDITLTPSSANIIAKYNIGSFDEFPYMYPHICKQFQVDWSSTNISSISIYLVNQNGDKSLLATSPGTYNRTIDQDLVYAGSWEQDFGVGELSDTGSDAQAHGVSGGTTASPELNFAFSLLKGYSASELWFEITVSNPALTCSIKYPKFIVAETRPRVVHETGQFSAIIMASGPGVRYGMWGFWDGDSVENPTVRPPGEKTSVLDWLCFKRVVLQAESKTNNLSSEISSLYDSYEGNTEEDVSQHTISFLTNALLSFTTEKNVYAILVNTISEVPPLACYPRKSRNLITFAEDGSWAQESWSCVKEPRDIVCGTNAVQFLDESGVRVDSTINILTGWKLARYNIQVDNEEGPTYQVVQDPHGKFADVSPWHGYYCVIAPSDEEPTTNPWNFESKDGGYEKCALGTDRVIFWRADQSVPIPDWKHTVEVVSGENLQDPRHAKDTRGVIYLVYCKEDPPNTFTPYQTISWDDGKTWSTPTAMGISNGLRPTIGVSPDNSVLRAAFVYNSGSSGPGKIKATMQHEGDANPSAVFTFKDSGGVDLVFDDTSFHVSAAYDTPRRWLLHCVIDGESSTSDWQSTDDGKTWSRI